MRAMIALVGCDGRVGRLVLVAVVLGTVVASGPSGAAGQAAAGETGPPTAVGADGLRSTELRSALVVSPEAASGGGAWVKELLAPHGVTVEVVGWKGATVAHARKFDLVIVTGPDRWIRGKVETGFDRPVLAVGSYGYTYFGKLRLKNGYPYS